MNKTKTIGMGIAGVLVGAGAMVSVASLEAAEKITVEDDPKKPKDELIISVEAPAIQNFKLADLKADIERLSRSISVMTVERDEKQALLDKLQVEVDKK